MITEQRLKIRLSRVPLLAHLDQAPPRRKKMPPAAAREPIAARAPMLRSCFPCQESDGLSMVA
jgi:hypothetical protein